MATMRPGCEASGAKVSITKRCPVEEGKGLISVITEISPSTNRHWSTQLLGERGSDTRDSVVSIVDADATVSQQCSGDSTNPTASDSVVRQRRAAALASTTG